MIFGLITLATIAIIFGYKYNKKQNMRNIINKIESNRKHYYRDSKKVL